MAQDFYCTEEFTGNIQVEVQLDCSNKITDNQRQIKSILYYICQYEQHRDVDLQHPGAHQHELRVQTVELQETKGVIFLYKMQVP